MVHDCCVSPAVTISNFATQGLNCNIRSYQGYEPHKIHAVGLCEKHCLVANLRN